MPGDTGTLGWEGVSVASPVIQRHPWEAPTVPIALTRNALWEVVRVFKALQSKELFNLSSGKETWFPHRHPRPPTNCTEVSEGTKLICCLVPAALRQPSPMESDCRYSSRALVRYRSCLNIQYIASQVRLAGVPEQSGWCFHFIGKEKAVWVQDHTEQITRGWLLNLVPLNATPTSELPNPTASCIYFANFLEVSVLCDPQLILDMAKAAC